MKLALVLNDKSGQFVRGDADNLAQTLKDHPAVDAVWRLDDELDGRIARAADDGFDVIAIAGGDGTIRGVADTAYRERSRVALLPLPLGTANLLVQRLYGSRSAKDLLDTAAESRTRDIRPGLANTNLFLVAAALGFPSLVARTRERLRDADGVPHLSSLSRRIGASIGHAFRPRIRYRHDARAMQPCRTSGLYIDLDLSEDEAMRYVSVNWRRLGDVVLSGLSILANSQAANAPGQAGTARWIAAYSRKPLPAMIDGEPVFLPAHVRIRRASRPLTIVDWDQ